MKLLTEKEYKSYLSEIRKLMERDPIEGSEDAERLKLISLAVENYEKNRFFFDKPSPVEAIIFRMEEMGLNQNDLAPYMGGKNRVSEILSKTRPLTKPMIKALHKYLNIPLEVLLQDDSVSNMSFSYDALEFDKEIMKDLQKKGWIKKSNRTDYRNIVGEYLKPIGGLSQTNVLCRCSPQANVRGVKQAAIFLWISKLLMEAMNTDVADFVQSNIDSEFLRRIAQLSYYDDGPLLAREELLKQGIILLIVPHLAGTFLDGGTVATDKGNPVIGLTLRYDRLDNFWHTLMHELVHIQKHFKMVRGPFLDDTDIDDSDDPIEKEADLLARDTFIPKSAWRSSDVIHFRTEKAIRDLANDLHIHPAIVAGRIRYETNNYRVFSKLIGAGIPKKLFGVK